MFKFFSSFQLLHLPKTELKTLDQSIIMKKWLELVYPRGSQDMLDIWMEKCVQKIKNIK